MDPCICLQDGTSVIFPVREGERRVATWSDSGETDTFRCVLCNARFHFNRTTASGIPTDTDHVIAPEIAGAYRLGGLLAVFELPDLDPLIKRRIVHARSTVQWKVKETRL